MFVAEADVSFATRVLPLEKCNPRGRFDFADAMAWVDIHNAIP
jgi:hypothetical protein